MFSKLFEMLPDAEHLLSLSAEQLAGPLLVSLEGGDWIQLEETISYDDMVQEIKRKERRIPAGQSTEIIFALMEAWQHLVSEGFLAPRPEIPSSSYPLKPNTFFVTRRGKKIETLEDYEDHRKADLLRKHQLHPIIADKVWSIFAQGSYGTAVLEAFRQVEIAVRKTGGYEKKDYGVPLMGKAFNEENGNLTDQDQHKDEKIARRSLFTGAIGAYKNPSSHREVEFTPEEAAEIIIFASHLLRIVDSCAERTSNSPN